MNKLLIVLLFNLLICAVPASAQSTADALNHFKGSILILRHPLKSNSQVYGSDGKVLGSSSEGAWTIYGGVLIEKASLKPDQLRIQGRRVLFLFQKGEFKAMVFQTLKDRRNPPPFQPEIKLEVGLDHPLEATEVSSVLNRIFAMNTAELMDSIPEFWRLYLHDRLSYDAAAQEEFSWHEPPPTRKVGLQPSSAGMAQRTDPDPNNSQTIYHVGIEVKAPHATYTPEPEFSEIARYEKYQGVVVVRLIVDQDGSVHQIQLVHPLGLGLDEQAEAGISHWKFSPAMRNGQPVAVEMNVEVAFNLY